MVTTNTTTTPTVVCYPKGTLTVVTTDDLGAASPLTTSAVYVLISHGPDGAGGYAAGSGVKQADPQSSQAQIDNYNGGSVLVQDIPHLAEGAGYFDDLAVWKTGANVVRACGAGLCGNPS
jgi:hypothetical protein